jgi:hypothetical protein
MDVLTFDKLSLSPTEVMKAKKEKLKLEARPIHPANFRVWSKC